jgi:hypothetical protein
VSIGDSRCDRCSAHAYISAVLACGTLDFCIHHANIYRLALVAAGAQVVDNSHQLTTA